MTYPTPTEPGFYWAWFHDLRTFMPVQVTQPNYGYPMRVLIAGLGGSFDLDTFTWGPRITMPEDLAVEEAGR